VKLAPLLDDDERRWLKEHGGNPVVTSRSPKRWSKRKRYFETLDRLYEMQRERGAPDPQDGVVLAELLAVMLRRDGTLTREFQNRQDTDLDDEGWRKLFRLLSRALVERWFRDRKPEPLDESTLSFLADQDYLDSLHELIELAQAKGAQAEQEAVENDGAVAASLADISDLTAEAEQTIVDHLTEQADLAADGEIPSDEEEHEIEKAALLQLRVKELRELAGTYQLEFKGGKEDLADLLLRRTNITREQIAEFVLKQQDDDPEQGMVTRLVPLDAPPDLDTAKTRLTPLQGRYVRLRTARWFIFEDVESGSGSLRISGRVRAFRAKPVLDTDSYKGQRDSASRGRPNTSELHSSLG
jgi:hypothetical protein